MPGEPATDDFKYPGNRLGLPAEGPGSAAGWGRRVVALFVDWFVASLVASAVLQRPLWSGGNDLTTSQLLVFCVMTGVLVGLLGFSIGHRLLGLRVIRLDERPVGVLRGMLRAVLVSLLIPPLVYDRDRRGLHDKAANTIVVLR
jgi:uncharacterized RDD family membrane protein YckC